MRKCKHGHATRTNQSAEYSAYIAAKMRCVNPNNPRYMSYGGRGIEFRFTSFEQFFAELGPRPAGMSLDRESNDGHYEVGNVRWATPAQQRKNQRHFTRPFYSRKRKKPCASVREYVGQIHPPAQTRKERIQ